MQCLHIDGRRSRFRLRTEHPGSPVQELSLPSRNLVGMNIELLGQFGQCLLALHGSQGHLRFECWRMVPAGSSAHRLSCSAAILAAVRQKTSTYPTCSKIPSQLWMLADAYRSDAARSGGDRPWLG